MTQIYKIVFAKFDAMPIPIKVIVYLIFVFSLIVQWFAPRYIDMRLVGTLDNGEFPLAEARVVVETKDRILRMVTDDQGRFSVPVAFFSTLSDLNFVLYPDSKSKREVDGNQWGQTRLIARESMGSDSIVYRI